MHLVPAGAMLPAWVPEAYQWSEDLYLEASQEEAQKYYFLPGGDSSERRFSPAVWAALKSGWPANHPLGALGPQKSWLIAMVLGLSGVPLLLGVENFVTQQAKADARQIQYLETGAEFSQLIDGVTDADYARGFSAILAGDAQTRTKSLADMYAAWTSGQLDVVVEAQQRSPLAQFPGVCEIIFDRRNLLWLPRIIASLGSNKRTLILVGAGHLAGEKGLLRLLEGAGYRCSELADTGRQE
jgi:uncharacterized protein YbaP (TraB family)